MTIELPEAIEQSIRSAVRAGRFSSADEAVTAAWLAFTSGVKPATAPSPLTVADIHRQMLADGLLAQLPDIARDVDDDDDEPVVIEGEPLSATVLRERR